MNIRLSETVLVLASMLLVSLSCGPSQPPVHRSTELIADYESTITIADAKGVVSATGVQWDVVERERFRISPSGDEVIVTLATAMDYRHLGFRGKLMLTFYDDRLARTSYFPGRFDEYLVVLADSLGIEASELEQGHQVRDTYIWAWRGAGDERFVGWRDEPLSDYYSPST